MPVIRRTRSTVFVVSSLHLTLGRTHDAPQGSLTSRMQLAVACVLSGCRPSRPSRPWRPPPENTHKRANSFITVIIFTVPRRRRGRLVDDELITSGRHKQRTENPHVWVTAERSAASAKRSQPHTHHSSHASKQTITQKSCAHTHDTVEVEGTAMMLPHTAGETGRSLIKSARWRECVCEL